MALFFFVLFCFCVLFFSPGDDAQLKSPSMLHRLLTLPSQLLDDDKSMELENAITLLHGAQTPHHDTGRGEDRKDGAGLKEQEEEQEEVKPRPCKSAKKNHVCKTCGRKFSRAHLLKAHWLTHRDVRTPCSKPHSHASTNLGKNT